ncbi:hypothetical protein AB1K70_06080 [Bremerella sp. JC770]|uniref:hypothetical protein n=1 Tax=Bremerella sp. JC770 TaxID=3232137 RepID=UPI00345A82D6
MIVSISEHRLKRLYADIRPEVRDAHCDGSTIVIGQVIHDLIDIRSAPIGNITLVDSGDLWLERASYDTSNCSVPIPNAYLARSIESFQQVAKLNCDAGKLALLPRSQQWKFVEAETALREWTRVNDPRCLDDPGSYWNELWSDQS